MERKIRPKNLLRNINPRYIKQDSKHRFVTDEEKEQWSSGLHGITDKWIHSSDAKARFYFAENSHTYIRSQDGQVRFRPGNGNDVMTIHEAGGVGIGTTNPNSKLDVRGQLRVYDGHFSFGYIDGNKHIHFRNASSNEVGLIWAGTNDLNLRNRSGGGTTLSQLQLLNGRVLVHTGNFEVLEYIKGRWRVLDGRDTNDIPTSSGANSYLPAPENSFLDRAVTPIFTQGWFGSSWGAGLIVKGWNGNYAAWSIFGNATTTTNNRWFLRSGVGSSWGSSREIITANTQDNAIQLNDYRIQIKDANATNINIEGYNKGLTVRTLQNDAEIFQVRSSGNAVRFRVDHGVSELRGEGSNNRWSIHGGVSTSHKGIRNIAVSTSGPSGGENGDVWMEY